MKYFLPILLLFMTKLQAQELQLNIHMQSYEDEIRIFWEPISWPENVEGINIKRKSNKDSNWKLLNKEVIQPATDKLRTVTNSKIRIKELEKIRDSLIKLKHIPIQTFIEIFIMTLIV